MSSCRHIIISAGSDNVVFCKAYFSDGDWPRGRTEFEINNAGSEFVHTLPRHLVFPMSQRVTKGTRDPISRQAASKSASAAGKSTRLYTGLALSFSDGHGRLLKRS